MAADRLPDGQLFDLYRTYIGEPDDHTDVYLGFGLFLGGITLALVALGLFLFSATLEPRSDAYFAWVQPAYALGMLSLPATMLGVVVLLPADRKVRYAAVSGVLVSIVAVAGFVQLYPSDWNFYGGSDVAFSTVHVVAVYAVGLASISASTGAALIGHYLDVARRAEAVAIEDEADEERTYSDEEIERDIDEAMEGVELSWGGVTKTEHTRLQFSDHEFEDANFDAGVGVKTTRSRGVDDAVAGLKGLKGGEAKTETSSQTVDEQTQKLKELREQQRREREAQAAAGDGVLARIRAKLAGVFGDGGR